jgi:hypothetical protein
MRKVKEEFNFRGMVEAGFETLPLHTLNLHKITLHTRLNRDLERNLYPQPTCPI